MYRVKALPVPRQAGSERKRALVELLSKVEAGEVIQSTDAVDIWPTDARSIALPWLDACKASQGSLDAAKALHEAVLPDWCWIIKSPEETLHLAHVSAEHDGPFNHHGTDPARAWLCAIIQALIANEDAKP